LLAGQQERIAMLNWLKQLDSVLRGEASAADRLKNGEFETPVARIALVAIFLGMIYGACMGLFAVLQRPDYDGWMQLLASTLKLPGLFFFTLAVTFPSLYVFGVLLGSGMSLRSHLRLMVAATGVMLAVLASLGPIVAFFTLSTTSYSFMVMLNVMAAAVGGFLGLGFMLRTLNRLMSSREMQNLPAARPAPVQGPPPPPDDETFEAEADEGEGLELQQPRHTLGGHDRPAPPAPPQRQWYLPPVQPPRSKARTVFYVWVIVYALVGAQMSWVLRPFIGDPTIPFEWFRDRDGNFFQSVVEVLDNLLGASGRQ
jgi:hypothetical protein